MTKEPAVKLTAAQRDVLTRMANGETIYQAWYSGRCIWEKSDKPAGKSTIDFLNDADLIVPYRGFRFRHDIAWIELRITDAGRTALMNK